MIDVKPATTLAEAADQIEEAMSYSADHYTRVCDVVLGQWLMVCRSIDVDALLELERGIMEDAADIKKLQLGVYGTCYLIGIARRIREALGIQDG